MHDFNAKCQDQEICDSPQNCVGSSFITGICDEDNTSTSNTHSSSKNALKKAYTYSLLKSRRRAEDKTREGRTKQWYH